MDETLKLTDLENEDEDNIENLSFADLLRKLFSIPEVGSLTRYHKLHTTFNYNL